MNIAVIGGWAPSLIRFRGPLLQAMIARGHRVITMAADGDESTTQALRDIGVQFVQLRLKRAGIDPLNDLSLVRQLVVLFRTHRIDATFAYTIKPVVYGSIAARIAGVPLRAAMITGLGYAFVPPQHLKHRAIGLAARGLYKFGLANCQHVFFQNPDDKAEFAKAGLLPSASGVTVDIVRGSGVDVDHYRVTDLPAISTIGSVRFLFIGRLLADKGIYEFIEMARQIRSRYSKAVFSVVGWMDPNPMSVQQSDIDDWQRAGIIEYLGVVSDVRPIIAACHVLVLPSYREGTPRSVLEAMSMGRAIITTDAPGCRETIIDGESGCLVPVKDANALAAAGMRLIENPALIEQFANSARQRIEQFYDARAVAASVLSSMSL